MKIPITVKGKFVLILSELKSGIVLNNDGSYYLNAGQDYYQIVDSKIEVTEIIEKHLSVNKEIEVSLYDHNGNFLEVYR